MVTIKYGYRESATGALEEDSGEQSGIARIRAARAAGLTVRAIAAELAAARVVSRNGKAHSVSSVGDD